MDLIIVRQIAVNMIHMIYNIFEERVKSNIKIKIGFKTISE